MNIFFPENTISKSVAALDDRRLIKQIVECKTLLGIATGEGKQGYAKHPVAEYYKPYAKVVAAYGFYACVEYDARFNKKHNCVNNFVAFLLMQNVTPIELIVAGDQTWYFTKPFYCEGSKNDPNCIRTTENVQELFRAKLCKKWDTDKIAPKWTNSEPPKWYKPSRTDIAAEE